MEQVLCDANIILRLLTNDSPALATKAQSIVEKAERGEFKLEVPVFIIAECVFVLQKVYKANRSDIALSLETICTNKGFDVENVNLVRQTLRLFAAQNLDFADAYLISHAQLSNQRVASFDRDLQKHGVDIIEK
jgi:predicted nucleic-acid-binding protein